MTNAAISVDGKAELLFHLGTIFDALRIKYPKQQRRLPSADFGGKGSRKHREWISDLTMELDGGWERDLERPRSVLSGRALHNALQDV